VQVWPRRPTFFEALSEVMGGTAMAKVAIPGLSLRGLPELLLAGEATRAVVLPFGLELH
jgi:hypothetical protein